MSLIGQKIPAVNVLPANPDTDDVVYYIPTETIQRWNGTAWVGAGSGTFVPLTSVVADGVTDNLSVLSAALNAAPNNGMIILPNGPIYCSAALPDLGAKLVTIQGQGWRSSVVAAFGDAQYGHAASPSATDWSGTRLIFGNTTGTSLSVGASTSYGSLNLRDLAIVGPGSGTSVGVGCGSAGGTPKDVHWSNVLVANFTTCVEWAAEEGQADRLAIRGAQTGLLFVSAPTNNQFNNLEVEATSVRGVDQSAGTLNVFVAPLFQGNTGVSYHAGNTGTQGNRLISPWFENAAGTKAVELLVGAEYTYIDQPHFGGAVDVSTIAAPHCTVLFPQAMQTIDLTGATKFTFIGESQGLLTNLPTDSRTFILDYNGGGTPYLQCPLLFPVKVQAHNLDLTGSVQASQGTWGFGWGTGGLYQSNTTGAAVNDYAEWDMSLQPGTYTLDIFMETGPDAGQVQPSVDGTNTPGGSYELYAASASFLRAHQAGIVITTAGAHALRLTVTGKNASSTGYVCRAVKCIATRTA